MREQSKGHDDGGKTIEQTGNGFLDQTLDSGDVEGELPEILCVATREPSAGRDPFGVSGLPCAAPGETR